ncbi:PIN domain-containing protein [Achromobacter animicus]|uniref:PIN domain-containing protein n=1 Tax=Achromobacter animicus TaxID=1389935 RepID=UPI0024486D79|nr:PIN domain-containing protein [Achromobacter animicus]MDH0683582.1 PIN domain-containing protein [Achromobacter animicus]
MKPTAVFIDTSILAGQGYNFSSAVLTAFVPVAQTHDLKLILPQVTEKEVKRQMAGKAQEALSQLADVRRKAPFLSKWKHCPDERLSQDSAAIRWGIIQATDDAWKEFLAQFDVVRLGYEGVKIDQVMAWYDGCLPPFGEGKKRKEFPDAFALAAVDAYEKKSPDTCIAVVSADKDLKKACERYSSLQYFQSLQRLTELLLKGDVDIDLIREIVSESSELGECIDASLPEFQFFVDDDQLRLEQTKTHGCSIDDLQIIGVGEDECTLSFDGSFEAEHKLCWMDWSYTHGPDEPPEPWEQEGWVSQIYEVSGVAKVRVNRAAKEVEEVLLIDFESERFTITKHPYYR